MSVLPGLVGSVQVKVRRCVLSPDCGDARVTEAGALGTEDMWKEEKLHFKRWQELSLLRICGMTKITFLKDGKSLIWFTK